MGFKLLILNCLMFFVGCSMFSSTSINNKCKPKGFSNCLGDKKQSVLRTDGYYEAKYMDSVMYNIGYDTHFKWDTVVRYIVVYSDGSMAFDIFPYSITKKGKQHLKKKKSNIEAYFKNIKIDIKYHQSYYENVWGIYEITNDTLNLQVTHASTMRHNLNAFESIAIINSSEQFTLVAGRRLGSRPKSLITMRDKQLTYHFIAYSEIPIPELSWIHQQAWAWCN